MALTIKEKQDILLTELLKHPKADNWAIFGVEAAVVNPLIKKGYLHADTYKHTGGAALTAQGREKLTT